MGLIEMLVALLVADQIISIWKRGLNALRAKGMASKFICRGGDSTEADAKVFFSVLLAHATDEQRVYLICNWWEWEDIPSPVFYSVVGRPYFDRGIDQGTVMKNEACVRVIAIAAALRSLEAMRNNAWQTRGRFYSYIAVRADAALAQKMFHKGWKKSKPPVSYEGYLTNSVIIEWMGRALSDRATQQGFGCDDPENPYWRHKAFLAPALSLLRSRKMADDAILNALEALRLGEDGPNPARLKEWVQSTPLNITGERSGEFFREIR